ncbi:putative threonine efflux protein [gamma proteobacterium IMCC2047]|nr:putative threonine efflux protein [gamma proteobacterium IMCC2047]
MPSFEFLIASLVLILMPGASALYTLSTGIKYGVRASMVAALSCTLGIMPHILASVLGLAALLNSSAVAFELVKWAGIAYLLYLAFSSWQSSSTLAIDSTEQQVSTVSISSKAFLVTTLNPKISIFFFAFLPQFVPPQTTSPVTHMLQLGFSYMLLTLLVFIGYGLLSHSFRLFIINSPQRLKGMQRSLAGAFVLLSVKLALAER